ncbi:MAG: hypothetical protein A2066_08240 [Bacteroidetes bacterium GWB2_41_8]|nr:MAG: hypothetical protein A2066_08240 [Bacteroidetes bacterium GWB2_41_8]
MKKPIFLALACFFAFSITGQLIAQNSSEAIQKTKTKSNQSNDRASSEKDESLKVKIRQTANGCDIVFNQAIVSPRDAASGLPTGKRQHKPVVFSKEYDKTSPVLAKSATGMGAGKVSMSDLSVTFTSKGRTQKLPVINNEFTLPDGTDQDCDLVVSWSWGVSNSGSPARSEIAFSLSIVEGACMAIKTKGTGAAHN